MGDEIRFVEPEGYRGSPGGLELRNIAMSKDGKHIAVANYLPHTLVLLSADDLHVEKIIEAKDAKGNTSRVSAVYRLRPATRSSLL